MRKRNRLTDRRDDASCIRQSTSSKKAAEHHEKKSDLLTIDLLLPYHSAKDSDSMILPNASLSGILLAARRTGNKWISTSIITIPNIPMQAHALFWVDAQKSITTLQHSSHSLQESWSELHTSSFDWSLKRLLK